MKYVHMRCVAFDDDDFFLASNQSIRNGVGMVSDGHVLQKGGATLAINEENRTIGISVCSTADQFCKRTGREIAMVRSILVVSDRWVVNAPLIGVSAEAYICNTAIEFAIDYIEKDNPSGYEYCIVRVDNKRQS